MAGLRTGVLLGGGLMLWMVSTGPLAPYRQALLDRSAPQLVLVLGGDVDRERMGAKLAGELDLPLLIGSTRPGWCRRKASHRSGFSWITEPRTRSAISLLLWMS